ncbi:hypothetical protein LCGC14_3141750, partial [marine sediment metagenome]
MKEESRKKNLEKNIGKEIEECDTIIEITSKALKELDFTQQKLLFTKENLESTNYNARWNKNVLVNIKDQRIHEWDPNFQGYFKAYN